MQDLIKNTLYLWVVTYLAFCVIGQNFDFANWHFMVSSICGAIMLFQVLLLFCINID